MCHCRAGRGVRVNSVSGVSEIEGVVFGVGANGGEWRRGRERGARGGGAREEERESLRSRVCDRG